MHFYSPGWHSQFNTQTDKVWEDNALRCLILQTFYKVYLYNEIVCKMIAFKYLKLQNIHSESVSSILQTFQEFLLNILEENTLYFIQFFIETFIFVSQV